MWRAVLKRRIISSCCSYIVHYKYIPCKRTSRWRWLMCELRRSRWLGLLFWGGRTLSPSRQWGKYTGPVGRTVQLVFGIAEDDDVTVKGRLTPSQLPVPYAKGLDARGALDNPEIPVGTPKYGVASRTELRFVSCSTRESPEDQRLRGRYGQKFMLFAKICTLL